MVTGMQVELVELATIYGGGLFFSGEAAGNVLDTLLTVGRDAPDEISLSAALMVFPDLPAVAPQLRGRYCCHLRVTSCGTPQRCEEVIRPLRQVATPLADTVRTMPVTEIGTIHNDPVTPRVTNSRSLVLRTADAQTVATLLRHAGPHTPYVIKLRQLGGALRREPPVANAVGHRHGAVTVYTTAYPHTSGPSAADGTAEQALLDDLTPWSDGGALINFLAGPHVTPSDVRSAYDADRYARLVEVKTTWDPDNVFRINHNIPPRPAGADPGTNDRVQR